MTATRTFKLRLAVTAGVFCLGAGGALAQVPAETGTGGGPTSTVTAPNTSSVGRTMPPAGGGAGTGVTAEREQRTPQQRQDDKIQNGICIGCDK